MRGRFSPVRGLLTIRLLCSAYRRLGDEPPLIGCHQVYAAQGRRRKPRCEARPSDSEDPKTGVRFRQARAETTTVAVAQFRAWTMFCTQVGAELVARSIEQDMRPRFAWSMA